MAIKLGSTNFGQIYLGSVNIGEAYYGSVKVFPSTPVDPYNPLNLPAYTMRFEFGDLSYDPSVSYSRPGLSYSWARVSVNPNVWDFTYYGDAQAYLEYNWNNMFSHQFKLENGCGNTRVLGANTSGVTSMQEMFNACDALVEFPLFDTSSVENFVNFAALCSNLTSVPPYIDISGVTLRTGLQGMFWYSGIIHAPYLNLPPTVTELDSTFSGCRNLETVPELDTRHIVKFSNTFSYCAKLNVGFGLQNSFNLASAEQFTTVFKECTGLTTLPTFYNYNNLTDVGHAFEQCYYVGSRILDTYNAFSSVITGNTGHVSTFWDCGLYSSTGSAELAQIPTSWGGTGT